MRSFFLLAFYISLALRAGAYVLPVIDAANLQQQVQNEYQNLTQYLSTVSNTLKSAQELEQQVLQLGQYANINNLPGVSTIGQIVDIGVLAKLQDLLHQFLCALERIGHRRQVLGQVLILILNLLLKVRRVDNGQYISCGPEG